MALYALQGWYLSWVGYGPDEDPLLYQRYVEEWFGGAIPYRDVPIEYPPGALLVFASAKLTGISDYRVAFGQIIRIYVSVLGAGIFLMAGRLFEGRRNTWLSANVVITFCLVLYISGILIHRRFDIVPAGLVLWAVVAHSPWFAGALLGLATIIKIWPAALVPAWMVWHASRHRDGEGKRSALKVALAAVGAVAAVFVPFWLMAGSAIFYFIHYHAERGLEFESSWALAIMSLNKIRGLPSLVAYHHHSDHLIDSSWNVLWQRLSLLITSVVVIWPALKLWRAGSDLNRRLLVFASAATIAGFMLTNRVFSPQFVFWIIPVASLSCWLMRGTSRWVALCCFAAVVLSTMYLLTVVYIDLRNRQTIESLTIAWARIACLVAFYVVSLGQIASPTKAVELVRSTAD